MAHSKQLELFSPDPANQTTPDRGGDGYDRFATDIKGGVRT